MKRNYLAIIYRESLHYRKCSRGCCGSGYSDSLFEKRYTEDRTELVNFLVHAYMSAYRLEASHDLYGDSTYSLFINGFPEDEYVDEFSDEDQEKRELVAEMAAIKVEVKLKVDASILEIKTKAADKARLESEKQVATQLNEDILRLADLERQSAELRAKLGT